mgnify:FL=1
MRSTCKSSTGHARNDDNDSVFCSDDYTATLLPRSVAQAYRFSSRGDAPRTRMLPASKSSPSGGMWGDDATSTVRGMAVPTDLATWEAMDLHSTSPTCFTVFTSCGSVVSDTAAVRDTLQVCKWQFMDPDDQASNIHEENCHVGEGAEEYFQCPTRCVGAYAAVNESTEVPQKRPRQATKQSARTASIEHAGSENVFCGEDAEEHNSTSPPANDMVHVKNDSREAPQKRPRQATEQNAPRTVASSEVGRMTAERYADMAGNEASMTGDVGCACRYDGGCIRTLDLLKATAIPSIVAVGDFFPTR